MKHAFSSIPSLARIPSHHTHLLGLQTRRPHQQPILSLLIKLLTWPVFINLHWRIVP